jgi:hypothetical protein
MPIQVPISGPINRARACQLNHQVITLLSSCPSYLDRGDPCTLVLLRNQGEDRKGKRFEHAGFGLQKNTNLWQSPRSHASSDWNVQAQHGKIIKSTFIWIQNYSHICSEDAVIIISLPRHFLPFLPIVLRHPILVQWVVYRVGSISESAFIPFVSFGDLDNNTFKGLMSLLSVEQEIQYDEHTWIMYNDQWTKVQHEVK